MGRGRGRGGDTDDGEGLAGCACLLGCAGFWGWYLIVGAAHALTSDYDFIEGRCSVHSASLVTDVVCGKNGCTYNFYRSYDVEILLPGRDQNIRVSNACDDFLTTSGKCNSVDWDTSAAKDAKKMGMSDIYAAFRDEILACPCETCAISEQACRERPLVVSTSGKPDRPA